MKNETRPAITNMMQNVNNKLQFNFFKILCKENCLIVLTKGMHQRVREQ